MQALRTPEAGTSTPSRCRRAAARNRAGARARRARRCRWVIAGAAAPPRPRPPSASPPRRPAVGRVEPEGVRERARESCSAARREAACGGVVTALGGGVGSRARGRARGSPGGELGPVKPRRRVDACRARPASACGARRAPPCTDQFDPAATSSPAERGGGSRWLRHSGQSVASTATRQAARCPRPAGRVPGARQQPLADLDTGPAGRRGEPPTRASPVQPLRRQCAGAVEPASAVVSAPAAAPAVRLEQVAPATAAGRRARRGRRLCSSAGEPGLWRAARPGRGRRSARGRAGKSRRSPRRG